MTVILGYSSEDLRTCVGFTMYHVLLCFENDIQSNCRVLQTFSFYSWCGVSVHLHIKVMGLRFSAKFEGVLQESNLKIPWVVSRTMVFLFCSILSPPSSDSHAMCKCSSQVTCLLSHACLITSAKYWCRHVFSLKKLQMNTPS